MGKLDGKAAIVMGAARSLGRAQERRLTGLTGPTNVNRR